MAPTQSERVRRASRERRAQQKEDLRQAILATASALIHEKGYEGFSLRQLAERIGYSATTIYLYFKDKDDLLATLVEDRFGRLQKREAAAMTEVKDPIERLRLFARSYLEFGLSDPAFFRGIYLQRPELLVRVMGHDRVNIGESATHQTLREAVEAGLIAPCDIDATAHALWAAMHGVVTLAVTIPPFTPEQIQAMADTMESLLQKGLR